MDFPMILSIAFMGIGLQFPLQIGASVGFCLTKDGCILGVECYLNGSVTTGRCILYQCSKGVWQYHAINKDCRQCHSQGDTTITTYDEHLINGTVQSSYHFDGSEGAYCFTQRGLGTHSKLGVSVTFNSNNDITNVFYAENGITVQFVSPGPDYDSKILVNGTETQLPSGPLKELHTTVGTTVWLTNDSPVWPPHRGGNIQIVGSQGLTVSIWAYQGYARHVNSYAMRSMETHLYGLCDVFTSGWPLPSPLPENYTMPVGAVTTNINEFTESWQINASSPACSCAWRVVVIELHTIAGCYIAEAAPTDNACHCTVIDNLPSASVEPICVATLVPCKDPTSEHCIKPGTGKPSCEEGGGNCLGYPLQPLKARG